MMSLSKKQQRFTLMVARLIQYAYECGYGLTFGEAHRPLKMAEIYAQKGIGIKNSLHIQRLAVDFNLFKDGEYLTDSESHAFLGKYWKALNPDNRWGGDFRNKDGNHYEYNLR